MTSSKGLTDEQTGGKHGSVSAITAALLLCGCAQAEPATLTYVSPGTPAIECVTRVNYDLFMDLPGYFVDDPAGKACVPFSYPASFAPAQYKGDYFANEFTDAKIRRIYAACKQNSACREKLAGIPPLNAVPSEFRSTGSVDESGKIDPHGAVDLKQIRRPRYFGSPQYLESIAEAEARAWVIEFQVPREAYERLHMKRTDPLALRGWYLEGGGVPDGKGGKMRALVVLIGGRSVETTAMQSPDARVYDYDKERASYVMRQYPDATSEKFGARGWRNHLYELNRAGFDVVTFDKRGHGISGGYNSVNTLEQGRDMWRALDALETGEGARALSPSGQLLEGSALRGRFLAGMKAKQIPVIFGGLSQGSITTAWAMHQNFVEDCTYDLPEVRCSAPHRYNVKGALLLATVGGGIGARPAPVDQDAGVLDEARSRIEHNVVMLPTAEPMTHIYEWPAVFFARGLWDFAESLEATFDFYRRAKGLKEIVVVRGPHGEVDTGENSAYVTQRMVAFSTAAVLEKKEVPGAARVKDLKELVGSSPAKWEPSSRPQRALRSSSRAAPVAPRITEDLQ